MSLNITCLVKKTEIKLTKLVLRTKKQKKRKTKKIVTTIKTKNPIVNSLKKKLKTFSFYEELLDVGKILSVKDGVAKVNGLYAVQSGEMVRLGSNTQGMVLSLDRTTVSVVVFGNDTLLKQNDKVYRK